MGQVDVTHSGHNKSPGATLPPQNKPRSHLELLGFVSVRFGRWSELSVWSAVPDPNVIQAQRRASPSVFSEIKIKLWDTFLPR